MKFFIPLFLVLLLTCEKNADIIESDSCGESYTIHDIWNKKTATMGFDNDEGSYFLSHHISGSIDGVITAYPCDLPTEFRIEGKKVTVSGNLFKSDQLPSPSAGGQEIWKIDIHDIEFKPDAGRR